MIKTLQKIFHLLSLQGKKKLYWLMFSVLVMAVLDMVGIASIFPFLNVLSDPNIIQENSKLKWAYDQFNFTSTNAFLIALGLIAFVFLLVNNILRAYITIALVSFTYTKRHILSKILLEKYLYESYAFFLNRNTSELTTYLVSEVARVITGVLLPASQVIAKSLMALFIIILLVIVDPIIASVVIVIIGGGYAVVYGFLRKSLSRIGTKMTEYSKIMYKSLSEAFGGIKDIKILNKEQIFIDEFAGSIKNTGDVYRLKFIIAQIPRYAFEILIFGGMLFIITLITFTRENSQSIIPIIGLYAFAAYRLMPTLQQIYQDVANIRSSLFALDVVYEDYITCTGKQAQHQENGGQTLPFLKSIELRDVAYTYPKAQKPVIKNFNLTVSPNMTIGFVGGTGAGKTTLIDILLGLLVPQEGVIAIDGVQLDENNLRMWQNNIGYVPQHIHLCDDTVARNIAFGVPDSDLSIKTLQWAAQLANIHDFVIKELPHGYKTEVGERGVRLSGGQRQRIGIARALYRNPSLLVFDEATSALDGITEDVILDAIHSLGHMKTIVMIAHRLSTVKECDVIYLLNEGRITDQGTYQELLTRNQEFRKMAKVYEHDDDDRLISSFEDVPECK